MLAHNLLIDIVTYQVSKFSKTQASSVSLVNCFALYLFVIILLLMSITLHLTLCSFKTLFFFTDQIIKISTFTGWSHLGRQWYENDIANEHVLLRITKPKKRPFDFRTLPHLTFKNVRAVRSQKQDILWCPFFKWEALCQGSHITGCGKNGDKCQFGHSQSELFDINRKCNQRLIEH